MGKPTGFMDYDKELPRKRAIRERIKDFKEIYLPFPKEKLRKQAARCMDCGVPTCHAGCPLGNLIPDWNDRVYRDQYQNALAELLQTNNFPEFTGRLCPAPCEEACVLAINEPAVTIEQIEKEIVEYAFEKEWIKAEPPLKRSDKTVAVIGSGPAGLACAQQLNRAGHQTTVFERADRIGGLLRYGIPDFKLEKTVLERRLQLMTQEGIIFKTNSNFGVNLKKSDLNDFDAVVLCVGATVSRELNIPGRQLEGIYPAMEFLTHQNRVNAGDNVEELGLIPFTAKNNNVIVIGGGDTGSDCIGTCHRQGAKTVVNFELTATPPHERSASDPWPFWPRRLRTSSSHEEGGTRYFGIMTKRFSGAGGHVQSVETVNVEFVQQSAGRSEIREIKGSERIWPADLVLLAMGFTGPETGTITKHLDLELDDYGNIQTDSNFMTRQSGIFAAGDGRRGQSLIVWAISEGRDAAHFVDAYLMGKSELPLKGCCDLR